MGKNPRVNDLQYFAFMQKHEALRESGVPINAQTGIQPKPAPNQVCFVFDYTLMKMGGPLIQARNGGDAGVMRELKDHWFENLTETCKLIYILRSDVPRFVRIVKDYHAGKTEVKKLLNPALGYGYKLPGD